MGYLKTGTVAFVGPNVGKSVVVTGTAYQKKQSSGVVFGGPIVEELWMRDSKVNRGLGIYVNEPVFKQIVTLPQKAAWFRSRPIKFVFNMDNKVMTVSGVAKYKKQTEIGLGGNVTELFALEADPVVTWGSR